MIGPKPRDEAGDDSMEHKDQAGKKPQHLMIIIGVGKPKPGQRVGFRGAKKKRKPDAKEK